MEDVILAKHYHFYAAHRNQLLNDKCKNLHGHTYLVTIKLSLDLKDDGVSMLFSLADYYIEPLINKLDHSTLVAKQDDRLIEVCAKYQDIFGKVIELPFVSTSLELLAFYIWLSVEKVFKGTLLEIEIKETLTSTISINKDMVESLKNKTKVFSLD